MKVATRHLAYPMHRYLEFTTFGDTNAAWFEAAQELGERAITMRSNMQGYRAATCTRSSSFRHGRRESLADARLINRMDLRPTSSARRSSASAASAALWASPEAADYTLAYPDQNAVLLAVETCSLTVQRDDLSTTNLIATGLFGDGAAAVIVSGSSVGRVESRTADPKSSAMGRSSIRAPKRSWAGTFRRRLQDRPVAATDGSNPAQSRRDVDTFLKRHGLTRGDVGNWVIHTGALVSSKPCRTRSA